MPDMSQGAQKTAAKEQTDQKEFNKWTYTRGSDTVENILGKKDRKHNFLEKLRKMWEAIMIIDSVLTM